MPTPTPIPTDTDTDTGPYNADTVQFSASWTYDEQSGEIVTATFDGKEVTSYFEAVVFNYEALSNAGDWKDVQKCYIDWFVSDTYKPGVEFDGDYWWSIDLNGIPVVLNDDGSGGCDNIDSLWKVPRGGAELESWLDGFDWGFGIKHFDSIDAKILDNWEDYWGDAGSYGDDFGDWDDVTPYMAGGAFQSQVNVMYEQPPYDVDIVMAYQVNPKTWALLQDGDGNPVPLTLESQAFAPSAYYFTLPMYIIGTGFGG
jgi:hypothetical protein